MGSQLQTERSQELYQKRQEHNSSMVLAQKERQCEYDEKVRNQWRCERSQFFSKQIADRLHKAKAEKNQLRSIFQIFVIQQQYIKKNSVNGILRNISKEIEYYSPNQEATIIEMLKKYEVQVQQLKVTLENIEQRYLKRRRECFPILQIIQKQINHLKVIHIQYQSIVSEYEDYFRYSILAFQFFKIIHQNNQLTEVILKGVSIQLFREFLFQLINQRPRKQHSWIKVFNPSKSLKLTINAEILFAVESAEDFFLKKVSFLLFNKKFQQLSEITMRIILGKWSSTDLWINRIEQLWECIRQIRKINIKIEGVGIRRQIPCEKVHYIRCTLFGVLARLRNIGKLSFKGINFGYDSVNDLLAIEQILQQIFDNNNITHLQIHHCGKFPIFPNITTLQSIDFKSIQLWRNFDVMSEIAQNNPSIQSIKCSHLQLQWSIHQSLCNHLNNFMVQNCNSFILKNSLDLSNLKHLSIQRCRNIDNLSMIFSRLSNIVTLRLNHINFEHQLLCSIPSPYMEELHIKYNPKLTDKELQQIDIKWPLLKIILLGNLLLTKGGCMNLNQTVWKDCNFKGLIVLVLDEKMFRKHKKGLQHVKRKGVRVFEDQIQKYL